MRDKRFDQRASVPDDADIHACTGSIEPDPDGSDNDGMETTLNPLGKFRMRKPTRGNWVRVSQARRRALLKKIHPK